MSPSLYNMYAESISKEFINIDGIKVGGRNINSIRYADDTALIAATEEDLQQLLSSVEETSKTIGFSINSEKTKVMLVSKTSTDQNVKILSNHKPLEQVKSFTLLGHVITENGSCDAEIRRRIGIARATFNSLRNILGNRKIAMTCRLRFLRCYVWSTLLYCCETWTMSRVHMDTIQAFEMWCLRRMMHVSWIKKKTNKEISQMASHHCTQSKIILHLPPNSSDEKPL